MLGSKAASVLGFEFSGLTVPLPEPFQHICQVPHGTLCLHHLTDPRAICGGGSCRHSHCQRRKLEAQKEELIFQDTMAGKEQSLNPTVKGSPDPLSIDCHFLLTHLLPGCEG